MLEIVWKVKESDGDIDSSLKDTTRARFSIVFTFSTTLIINQQTNIFQNQKKNMDDDETFDREIERKLLQQEIIQLNQQPPQSLRFQNHQVAYLLELFPRMVGKHFLYLDFIQVRALLIAIFGRFTTRLAATPSTSHIEQVDSRWKATFSAEFIIKVGLMESFRIFGCAETEDDSQIQAQSRVRTMAENNAIESVLLQLSPLSVLDTNVTTTEQQLVEEQVKTRVFNPCDWARRQVLKRELDIEQTFDLAPNEVWTQYLREKEPKSSRDDQLFKRARELSTSDEDVFSSLSDTRVRKIRRLDLNEQSDTAIVQSRVIQSVDSGYDFTDSDASELASTQPFIERFVTRKSIEATLPFFSSDNDMDEESDSASIFLLSEDEEADAKRRVINRVNRRATRQLQLESPSLTPTPTPTPFISFSPMKSLESLSELSFLSSPSPSLLSQSIGRMEQDIEAMIEQEILEREQEREAHMLETSELMTQTDTLERQITLEQKLAVNRLVTKKQ